MKKIIFLLALACLSPWHNTIAQDVRQRSVTTIITDGLNELPANNIEKYNTVIGELAATGAAGVTEIADMLVPTNTGKNATIEYALHGIVSYVTVSGKEKEKAQVRKGLSVAIDKCMDNSNKAFLLYLLQRCATSEDAPVFVKYINDDYLSEWAVNGLAHTQGTDNVLLDLIQRGIGNKARLAYAVGVKKLYDAEPILLEWLKSADKATQKAIYHALSICGSSRSLPILKKAARSINYSWSVSNDATSCYLRLLQNLSQTEESKIAVKAAKSILKATDIAYVRGAALEIIISTEGSDAIPFVLAAVKDNNREYRVNALRLSEKIANDNLYASLGKMLLESGSIEMKADILNWLGTNHVISQTTAVTRCMSDNNENVVLAAIKAAGKIGGETSLTALIKELKGIHADAATQALLSFNGKINKGILKALDADKTLQIAALKIASARSMDVAATRVFSLMNSEDDDIKAAAYKALPGVVNHFYFNQLSQLAENADSRNVYILQDALKNALASLSKEQQFATVISYVNKSQKPYLYYPNLAEAGTNKAIEELYKGYNGVYKKEAIEALLQIDNSKVIDLLYSIAVDDKDYTSIALNRYADLVSKSDYNIIRKYQYYRKALELTTDINIQKRLIFLLGETPTYQALMFVSKFMNQRATMEAAASAVRNIISKNPERFGGTPVREVLEKAIACFKEIGHADAGYAIDDINKMLQELPEAAYVSLFNNTQWDAVAWPMNKSIRNNNSTDTWERTSNGMKYLGDTESILGIGDYENFELCFEWKGNGKAGVGIRSICQIDLGGERSGTLSYNTKGKNVPEKIADNAKGEWNTVYMKVQNDRVIIKVNGITTTNNVIIENTSERNIPVCKKGKILLIGKEEPVEIREMYIRELPSTPIFELSEEEKKEGV